MKERPEFSRGILLNRILHGNTEHSVRSSGEHCLIVSNKILHEQLIREDTELSELQKLLKPSIR